MVKQSKVFEEEKKSNPELGKGPSLLQKFRKFEEVESKNMREQLDELNSKIPPLEFLANRIDTGKITKPISFGGSVSKLERLFNEVRALRDAIETFMEKSANDEGLAEELSEKETGEKMQEALDYFEFLGKQVELRIAALKPVTAKQPYVAPYSFHAIGAPEQKPGSVKGHSNARPASHVPDPGHKWSGAQPPQQNPGGHPGWSQP